MYADVEGKLRLKHYPFNLCEVYAIIQVNFFFTVPFNFSSVASIIRLMRLSLSNEIDRDNTHSERKLKLNT